MRLRRLLLICVMSSLLLAGVGCGTHPLIDTWANRGITGVRYGQDNIIEFRNKMQEVLTGRKDTDVDGLFQEILEVSKGQRIGEDGQPVELDEGWIAVQAAALKFLVRLWDKDQNELDKETAKAIDNLNQVIETFEQIKRLRRAWGDWDAIQVQIEQLSGTVQQLITARQGSK